MTTATGFELGTDGPKTLVVGVDGSDTSWRALCYALGLARRQQATVLAVFAVTAPVAALGWSGDIVGAITEANMHLADELKHAIQTLAADYRVPAEFISRTGDPVSVLIQIAHEQHADALLVGASQTLIHHVLPSKTIRAIRRCRCPVTVVP